MLNLDQPNSPTLRTHRCPLGTRHARRNQCAESSSSTDWLWQWHGRSAGTYQSFSIHATQPRTVDDQAHRQCPGPGLLRRYGEASDVSRCPSQAVHPPPRPPTSLAPRQTGSNLSARAPASVHLASHRQILHLHPTGHETQSAGVRAWKGQTGPRLHGRILETYKCVGWKHVRQRVQPERGDEPQVITCAGG